MRSPNLKAVREQAERSIKLPSGTSEWLLANAVLYLLSQAESVMPKGGALLEHGRNCPANAPSYYDGNDCTCGLKWRIELQTEREMHNAWRKRAEEAEAALAAQTSPAAGEGRTLPHWVAIADGEGAEARPIYDVEPHQALHDFMCVCGKPWKECDTEDIREDVKKIDDPDEWGFDEQHRQFSIFWEHECGKVTLYRVWAAENHDFDKVTDIDGFHRDFVTGFKQTEWWDRHRQLNRHHLNNDDGVRGDVNLIDVLDFIADCVMAGMARSGSVTSLRLSPELLEKAFQNIVELLKRNVQVVSPERRAVPPEPGAK